MLSRRIVAFSPRFARKEWAMNKYLCRGNLARNGDERLKSVVTNPTARSRTINGYLSSVINFARRHVALWAKRKPLSAGSLSSFEFNRFVNSHLLGVFRFESPKLLLCLVAVKCYNLKLRLKLAVLRLQNRYLSFKCRRLVKRQRKTLAETRNRPPRLTPTRGCCR